VSFVRLYTSETQTPATCYTYDAIWDVQIDAETITGANYYTQESRKASFTMLMDSLFETTTFIGNPNKPAIYRAIIEFWESFTYADANSDIQTYERLLFRGYLFQESFKIDTQGVYSGTKARTITITAFDYLAVFLYYLKDNITHLAAGQRIPIENEYRRIWELVPYSASSGSTLALWARPALTYSIDAYPDYGFNYSDFEMFTQTAIGGTPFYYGAWLYQIGNDIFLEEIALEEHFFGHTDHFCRYLVKGASLIPVAGYPINVSGIDYLWEGSYTAAIANYSGVPAGVDKVQTLTVGAVTYSIEDIYQDEGSVDGYYLKTLLLTGIATATELEVIEATDINTISWWQYMINIQFGWLYSHNNGFNYYISNKAFLVSADTAGFSSEIKVTDYSENMDGNRESYDTSNDFIVNDQVFKQQIDTYAKDVTRRFNRVCSFGCNSLVHAGQYVHLLEHNQHMIHIIEASYNPTEPFLYHYKGRSR
jgi:hypothetical protein